MNLNTQVLSPWLGQDSWRLELVRSNNTKVGRIVQMTGCVTPHHPPPSNHFPWIWRALGGPPAESQQSLLRGKPKGRTVNTDGDRGRSRGGWTRILNCGGVCGRQGNWDPIGFNDLRTTSAWLHAQIQLVRWGGGNRQPCVNQALELEGPNLTELGRPPV